MQPIQVESPEEAIHVAEALYNSYTLLSYQALASKNLVLVSQCNGARAALARQHAELVGNPIDKHICDRMHTLQ